MVSRRNTRRRMTTKKNTSKKVVNVSSRTAGTARPMTTKASRPGRPKGKPKAKADRADQAFKTLVKSMKKKEGRQ